MALGFTVEMLTVDVLTPLKEHGMPAGFRNQRAFEKLVQSLEKAPTYEARVELSNRLVALQNGDIKGSKRGQQQLAGSMSLLWGMSVGAYLKESPRLSVPKEMKRSQRTE